VGTVIDTIKKIFFKNAIRCTAQPSFISCAVSQAGVAATASGEAEDKHYLDTVNNHGGEFIPLVCEFGLPLPYQLYLHHNTVKS